MASSRASATAYGSGGGGGKGGGSIGAGTATRARRLLLATSQATPAAKAAPSTAHNGARLGGASGSRISRSDGLPPGSTDVTSTSTGSCDITPRCPVTTCTHGSP